MHYKKRTPSLDNREFINESVVFGVKSGVHKKEISIRELLKWTVNEDNFNYQKTSKRHFSGMGNYGKFKAKINRSSNMYTSETHDQFGKMNLADSYLKQKINSPENPQTNNEKQNNNLNNKIIKINCDDRNCKIKFTGNEEFVIECVCKKIDRKIDEKDKFGVKLDRSISVDVETNKSVQKNKTNKTTEIVNMPTFLVQKSKRNEIVGKDPIKQFKSLHQKINRIKKRDMSCKEIAKVTLTRDTNLKIVKETPRQLIGEPVLIPGLKERIKELHGLTRLLPDSTVQSYTNKPAFQNYGRNYHRDLNPLKMAPILKTHNINPQRANSKDRTYSGKNQKSEISKNNDQNLAKHIIENGKNMLTPFFPSLIVRP